MSDEAQNDYQRWKRSFLAMSPEKRGVIGVSAIVALIVVTVVVIIAVAAGGQSVQPGKNAYADGYNMAKVVIGNFGTHGITCKQVAAVALRPSSGTPQKDLIDGNEPKYKQGVIAGCEAELGASRSHNAPGVSPSAAATPAPATYTYQDGWNAAEGVTEVDLMAAAGQQIPPTYPLSLFDENYCRDTDPNGISADSTIGAPNPGSVWFQGCVAELEANPPAPPVITSSSPGYSEGYSLAEQQWTGGTGSLQDPTFAQENLDSYGGATGWCDEYADPEFEYAPQVTGVGTDANPADDPAVAGCIAALNALGLQ
jgi:hypothetical protein